MPRLSSLNILLDPTGKDYLSELYGKVIQNVQKGMISTRLKNTNLSGDPLAGSVEAKRIAFATSKPYGTARAAGKGDAIKAKPVTVALNKDRELVEEMENKDTRLWGVDGLVEKRATEHERSMKRELEGDFFAKASEVATVVTPSGTDPIDRFEAIVLQVETTKNDYVQGVPRDMIHVVMQPAEYSKVRKYVDTNVQNANVDSSIEEFGKLHGVNVYSSIDLPAEDAMQAMCEGAIAQPVHTTKFDAEKVNLSNAIALELFFSYGTEAVMPDLVAKITA